MNKSKKVLFVILLLLTLTIIGAVIISISVNTTKNSETQEVKDDKFTIVTSFYPMYIATMNIVDGADVNLQNLSEPKTGCLHDYQLTTEDMKLLSTADVFVVNGGGMEEFLSDVVSKYPSLTIVDASKGIDMEDENAHIWMSISKYIKQVENITKGLSDANPTNSQLYQDNATKYVGKLQEILAEEDASLSGKKVVLFSEAYGYLADDFKLDVKGTLDLDEEKDISAKELAETVDIVKNNNVPLIIAEKEYGEKMAIFDNKLKLAKDNRMKSNIELLKGAV